MSYFPCREISFMSESRINHVHTTMAADSYVALEQRLEMFIENVRQVGIIVSDFQPQGQGVLNQKLNTMVMDMQDMERLRTQIVDVQVPLEVFEYIDSGKNPSLYTRDCLEKALEKNESVKGKMDALKRFRAQLVVALKQYFPNEINMYRALRNEDRPT